MILVGQLFIAKKDFLGVSCRETFVQARNN
jgi:hypothetical protein